ncbi:hypothetical protein HRbin36_02883 [bacterium HR36]|nr:hypothetical protein HRbin36_02883 [bacterium HR36]
MTRSCEVRCLRLGQRRYLVSALALTLGSVSLINPASENPTSLGPTAYAQSKADEQLAQLMKRKLEASQKILEGLALAHFDVIVTNAETLIFISRQAAFRVLPTPEYELHSNEFRRIAGELAEKAREKNLDGAMLKYVDLTLTCVKCHKHVRDRRGAQRWELPHLGVVARNER